MDCREGGAYAELAVCQSALLEMTAAREEEKEKEQAAVKSVLDCLAEVAQHASSRKKKQASAHPND